MKETENLRHGAVLQSFSRVTIPVLSLLVPLSSVHRGAPWQQGGNKLTRAHPPAEIRRKVDDLTAAAVGGSGAGVEVTGRAGTTDLVVAARLADVATADAGCLGLGGQAAVDP